jgi:adenosylhomocysteine nucleosidase
MPARHVVVLAPMPLEMEAIVGAFGLQTESGTPARATGEVAGVAVTALHIGMGPPGTRAAVADILDNGLPGRPPADHIMIAGICGGLDPEVPVGTLINPEILIDHTSGETYAHRPPGDLPLSGKLITTEGVSLESDLTRQFFADGCVAVDMESAAVAQICEPRGHGWSVYRCIGDRPFDGRLDDRLIAMTNPDGTGRTEEIAELVAKEPEMAAKLAQLAHDSAMAARLAAEAAVRGCQALAER